VCWPATSDSYAGVQTNRYLGKPRIVAHAETGGMLLNPDILAKQVDFTPELAFRNYDKN